MAAKYINTDINLKSRFDLGPLLTELERHGLFPISGPIRRGNVWSVVLEHEAYRQAKPEARSQDILKSVESLQGEYLAMWEKCFMKEFDLGFEYTGQEFSSQFMIKPDLLRRITTAGMSLVVTIYRNSDEDPQNVIQAEKDEGIDLLP